MFLIVSHRELLTDCYPFWHREAILVIGVALLFSVMFGPVHLISFLLGCYKERLDTL